MANLSRADIARLPDGNQKRLLQAALDVADRQHAKAEKERIDKLPDIPIIYRKAEKRLQGQCEGLLSARGFRRMTAPEAEACVKPDAQTAGWFFHMHKPMGNPLCPDLIIFDRTMTRCLCIELKTRLVYQAGQGEMIRFGAWYLAESFFDFVALLDNWAGGKPLREMREAGDAGPSCRQASRESIAPRPFERRGTVPYASRRGTRKARRIPRMAVPEPA